MSDHPRTDAEKPEQNGWLFYSLAQEELTAAQAEIARLKAGGCARDQRTTQFCGEALKLQEENARLQERIRRFEAAGDAILWYFRPKDTGDISFLQSEAMKQWAAAKDTQ